MAIPPIKMNAPTTHGHTSVAVNCASRVAICGARTATIVAITTMNGPNTRANIRVRGWDCCEMLMMILPSRSVTS
jgi:hypothetical protein